MIGVYMTVITLIFILIWYTIAGISIRQTEIDNVMTASMQSAMNMLTLDEGRPKDQDEWIGMFLSSAAAQIESDSTLTVRVIDADMEKGYLSAEGVLTFRHPIGTEGSVTSGRRDIILEQYEKD